MLTLFELFYFHLVWASLLALHPCVRNKTVHG